MFNTRHPIECEVFVSIWYFSEMVSVDLFFSLNRPYLTFHFMCCVFVCVVKKWTFESFNVVTGI